MSRAFVLLSTAWLASVAISLPLVTPAPAQTIWSGLSTTFTKANGTDPLLAQNQDRITNNVWITRDPPGRGLVNAASECSQLFGCSYTHNSSPADTAWATARLFANSGEPIVATNWQNLTFADWETAYGNQVGQFILDPNYRDAVVHLITDNIYLDLRFTGWTTQGGGGFSYQRATASAPPSPTGDYNGNHVVDAADYIIWRDQLNQTVPQGTSADGNSNGTIDAGDVDYWRQRFGNAAPGAAAGTGLSVGNAVPEPDAMILLLSSLIAFLRRPKETRP